MAPKDAVADGALGFWKAIGEVWPKIREQRCWVHKSANILNQAAQEPAAQAKRMLQDIWMAETRKDGNHLRDRTTQDDPLEGMPLERHGVQVGRRRAEDLASP
jgi:transposase-like protein